MTLLALRRIATLAILLMLGCETSIEPKTTFVERPILYGIATSSALGDISQKIILTRTYDVEGLQLPDTSSDRGIPGASVTLTVGGRDFFMEESLFTFRNTAGGISTRLMYIAPPLRFGAQTTMAVRAHLPDGKTLTAETVSPPFFFFESSYSFARGITSAVRDRAGDAWILRWQNMAAHLFWPSLSITYQKQLTDSTRSTRVISVPMTFARRNGVWEDVYPSRTYEPTSSFTFDAIDSAMARISEGDPDKGSYRVISATFSVTTYDPHLARYYTSIRGSIDEYSIRSDPAFYSNVQGGIGVLGSQTTSSFIYQLDPLYVRSFGYQSSG